MNKDNLEVKPNIQPKLTALLLTADEADVIDVVIVLHVDGESTFDSPDTVKKKSDKMLTRVALEVRQLTINHTIFENLQSLAVRARPVFLRCLVQQPEIRSVICSYRS